jgi:hypothetical protein
MFARTKYSMSNFDLLRYVYADSHWFMVGLPLEKSIITW